MTDIVLLLAGRAEVEALGKAISTVRSEPDGRDRLAAQMEILTAHCVSYPAETRRLWDWFEKQEPCLEAGEMSEVIEGHRALIDERMRLIREVHALATDGDEARRVALAAALADLSEQRGRLAGLLERLNAPMPPLTEPEWTTADCRAAFERGEYETIESIIARVQVGGPVSKDDAG